MANEAIAWPEPAVAGGGGVRRLMQRLLSRGLTLEDIWLLLPLPLIFLSLETTIVRPQDFWWHLRTGQIIVQTGAVPSVDLFTFTQAGQPWTNESWLWQAAYYLLYQAGNLPLLILAHALTITAGYLLIQRACLVAAGGNVRAAALATVATALLGIASWSLRPQAISFPFFALLVLIIERQRREGGRALWLLPPLFAVWANAHGAFVFGLGLLGIYALSCAAVDLQRARRLGRPTVTAVLCLAACGLAAMINPAGPMGTVDYVLGFFHSKTTINANMEFLPISIREVDGVFFFAITLPTLALAYRRRPAAPLYWAAAFIIFGVATLYIRRMSPWFGLAAGPILAAVFAAQPELAGRSPQQARRPLFNYILLAILCALVIAGWPWLRPHLPLSEERRSFVSLHETPAQAVQTLCAMLPPGTRLLNDQSYGGYLAWACPALPIFIDTRIELYPSQQWRDYFVMSQAAFGWEEKLEHYAVAAVLAGKQSQAGLLEALRQRAGWQPTYEDENTAIFVRAAP